MTRWLRFHSHLILIHVHVYISSDSSDNHADLRYHKYEGNIWKKKRIDVFILEGAALLKSHEKEKGSKCCCYLFILFGFLASP